MSASGVRFIIVACALLLLGTGGSASADIYRYVDENGVWHFTNINTDARYRIYIRKTTRSPSDYIKTYKGIIRQASRRFGVAPALILSLIHI